MTEPTNAQAIAEGLRTTMTAASGEASEVETDEASASFEVDTPLGRFLVEVTELVE